MLYFHLHILHKSTSIQTLSTEKYSISQYMYIIVESYQPLPRNLCLSITCFWFEVQLNGHLQKRHSSLLGTVCSTWGTHTHTESVRQKWKHTPIVAGLLRSNTIWSSSVEFRMHQYYACSGWVDGTMATNITNMMHIFESRWNIIIEILHRTFVL